MIRCLTSILSYIPLRLSNSPVYMNAQNNICVGHAGFAKQRLEWSGRQ